MQSRFHLLMPLLSSLLLLAVAGCATTAETGVTPRQTDAGAMVVPANADDLPEAVATTEPAYGLPVIASPPAGDIADDVASTALPDATAGLDMPDPRTQAEQDFDAIYGVPQDYDPVFDPTLPAAVELVAGYDPWEPLNRRVHAFNNVIDAYIALPLARAYVAVVPRPVRLGVGNFFNNLGQPLSALNALLQGKPQQAGTSLARFAVNATLGLGGVIDTASMLDIPNSSEDFGQTLGIWGWKQSRYVELPLFGPRTVRDVFGLVGDAPLSMIRPIQDDTVRIFLQGLQLVDVRTQLMVVDNMREGAIDEYTLYRDAWTRRRNYQIFGDRTQGDESLPEYLRDDTLNPTVPVDAMPVPVPGG